jgi:dienelactone hydrolase
LLSYIFGDVPIQLTAKILGGSRKYASEGNRIIAPSIFHKNMNESRRPISA